MAAHPSERPNIFQLYEENVGMLTPLVADELRAAEEEYPAGWVEAAIREAAAGNVRSWRYIEAILERWKREGEERGQVESLGDILRRLQQRNFSNVADVPEWVQQLDAESPVADACPTCGGHGWVRRDLPVGHPDFGRAFPCLCQMQRNETGRLARLQRYSNLGVLHNVTFETLAPSGPGVGPEANAVTTPHCAPRGPSPRSRSARCCLTAVTHRQKLASALLPQPPDGAGAPRPLHLRP